MTKKSWSFKLDEETSKVLRSRIDLSNKSISEFLAELVSNALGVTGIPSEQSSGSDSSLFSPKRQEGEPSKHRRETQSVESEVPCFCRFEHNGLLWCANRPPPSSAEITTIKRCKACLKRVTKEKEDELKTRYYATCGAKEFNDKKKGLMLYCEKYFQGQWITPKDCETVKCVDLKVVKGQW